jgi:hypothetical protein
MRWAGALLLLGLAVASVAVAEEPPLEWQSVPSGVTLPPGILSGVLDRARGSRPRDPSFAPFMFAPEFQKDLKYFKYGEGKPEVPPPAPFTGDQEVGGVNEDASFTNNKGVLITVLNPVHELNAEDEQRLTAAVNDIVADTNMPLDAQTHCYCHLVVPVRCICDYRESQEHATARAARARAEYELQKNAARRALEEIEKNVARSKC